MAYSEKVLDHYENPRNVGKMDVDDNSVGTGSVSYKHLMLPTIYYVSH